MKRTTDIIAFLSSDIKNKNILEVACGCAELSISASDYADAVYCIDIDNSRLPESLPDNVYFDFMDASQMCYTDELFDTIILYNAFYHVYSQWELIKKECMRVLKPLGKVYIVSTWKLDYSLMREVFNEEVSQYKDFFIVKIEK